MNKVIISSREQLLSYIADHIRYPHLVRAINEGTAENLGAFNVKGGDGWIVRVRSIICKTDYYAGVTIVNRGYRLLLTNVEPGWKYWVGDISENKLYQGDNPDKYALLRDKEIENAKT